MPHRTLRPLFQTHWRVEHDHKPDGDDIDRFTNLEQLGDDWLALATGERVNLRFVARADVGFGTLSAPNPLAILEGFDGRRATIRGPGVLKLQDELLKRVVDFADPYAKGR